MMDSWAIVPGALAFLPAMAGFMMLWKRFLSLERKYSELVSVITPPREENAEQISHPDGCVEAREQIRSALPAAIQLLGSGISPESAASSLGLGTREVRLIARAARILPIE